MKIYKVPFPHITINEQINCTKETTRHLICCGNAFHFAVNYVRTALTKMNSLICSVVPPFYLLSISIDVVCGFEPTSISSFRLLNSIILSAIFTLHFVYILFKNIPHQNWKTINRTNRQFSTIQMWITQVGTVWNQNSNDNNTPSDKLFRLSIVFFAKYFYIFSWKSEPNFQMKAVKLTFGVWNETNNFHIENVWNSNQKCEHFWNCYYRKHSNWLRTICQKGR